MNTFQKLLLRYFSISIGLSGLIVAYSFVHSASSTGAPAVEIPITAREWSNVARVNDPITVGMPIPQSATGGQWALFDGSTEIPVQTTILPGLKTPWVLLDFQTTQTAGQAKSLNLKQQPPTVNAAQPLVVTEDASQITVTSGPARFQISKTNFNLLENVWLDKNGNSSFADSGENIITPSGVNNIQVADVGSGLTFAAAGAPTNITWEDNGPMRATLKIDGTLKNGSTVLMDYTTRLTFYAGQKFVNIEQVLRNSSPTQQRYIKLSSATVRVGAGGTAIRSNRSGDFAWANVDTAGLSYQLIPSTVEISPGYAPYADPPVYRSNVTVNVDTNGGLIVGDLSYLAASARLDFSEGLSAGQKTILTAAAKDPIVPLAAQSWYSDQGAFGLEHYSTYDDEKNSNIVWGWSWPTPGNQRSYEHSMPRVQSLYPNWSNLDTENDPESDDLNQNLVMYARVGIPFYLDRARAFNRYWKSEWSARTDGFAYAGAWGNYWDGPGTVARPLVEPTLTTDDASYIDGDITYGKNLKASDHLWNGGAIDYYYLTGDRDSLQASIDTAEECQRFYSWQTLPSGGVGGDIRFPGRCLLIFTRTWEATGDAQWKAAADHLITLFLQSPRFDSRGFFYNAICDNPNSDLCQRFPNGKEVSPFMTGTVIEGLYRYYIMTNDQSVRSLLIQIAQFGRDHGLNPSTQYGGDVIVVDSPSSGTVLHLSYAQYRSATPDILITVASSTESYINAMVIGFRLTGDHSYLRQAKYYWNQGTKRSYISPYDVHIATDSQVGRWANSLQDWDPDSLLFEEGGDWTTASLLFYEAARADWVLPGIINNLQ